MFRRLMALLRMELRNDGYRRLHDISSCWAYVLTDQEKSIGYLREDSGDHDDEYWELENYEQGVFDIFDEFDDENCD